MSIILKGVDLPKEGEVTFIAIKGKTAIETYKGINVGYYSAIQIPTPHGRLIDRDDIYIGRWDIDSDLAEQIQNAPTILEAEE